MELKINPHELILIGENSFIRLSKDGWPIGVHALQSLARAVVATFAREGTPPNPCAEVLRTDKEEIRLSWSDFLKPFNFEAPPGFDNRPIGCQTTFFPAQSASLSVNGQKADGPPWRLDRGGKPCTTACLAWCETWFRP